MASKNVRKIYSKSSDEVVKVDMADRDGQGNVIHETYATKSEASGGTKRYRHSITAKWSGGTGAAYIQGSLSLSFIDTTSSSYSTNGNRTYDKEDFLNFLQSHIALKTSGENFITASGGVQKNSGSAAVVNVVTYLNYHADYGTWYVGFIHIGSSERGYGENYAMSDVLFPIISGKYLQMYDLVEEL